MRKLLWVVPAVTILSLLLGTGALAQVQVIDHQELLSGGAISPDLEASSPGPSSPTGAGRPPRVGPNARVNDPQQALPLGLLGRSETSVAASEDGQGLVAGWNDAQGFCGAPFGSPCTPPALPGLSGYGYSSDGGLTWVDGGAPPVIDHVFTRGDPWLDRGGFDNATFYYANLAVDDRSGASLGVSVHRGHFGAGGFTWEDVRTFNSANPNDFYDKEAVAAAKDGSGAAYVSLTNFIQLACPAFPNTAGAFGQIEVWRTHDGGSSWQGPSIVSPDRTDVNTADPNCGNTGVLQQSSVPAIGPGGEVYVTWQLGPTFSGPGGTVISTDAAIYSARSLDGGATFATPVKVADINSMRQNPPVGYNRSRLNDHPRIAVETSGSHRGRIYVAYYSAVSPVAAALTSQSLVSSQVYLAFSDDQGQTWSAASEAAPAAPAEGIKRFWPVVTVEPGGNVDVIYYESRETQATPNPADIECNISIGGGLRRRGTVSSLVDTYWAQSTDGGATFGAPVRVSSATSNWCTAASNIRPNFGDYIGSAGGGNRVFPLWADGRNGVPDVFFAGLLGAGKSP